jgi:hypothetical protein
MKKMVTTVMAAMMVAGSAMCGEQPTDDNAAIQFIIENRVFPVVVYTEAGKAQSYLIEHAVIPVSAIISKLIPMVRVQLRKEGKSIIVKDDGVDNVKDRMAPVVEAFNTPCREGMLEAIAFALGVELLPSDIQRFYHTGLANGWTWDTYAATMKALVEQNMKDSLTGQVTPLVYVIRLVVGVEAYNKFIEEYNKL